MTFSFDPNSSKSDIEQVKDYLRGQNYVNRIDRSIRETGAMNAEIVAIQSQEIKNAINVSSQKERESIIELRDSICSTLESGFSDLNDSLRNIDDGINGLSNLVGHGFSLVAEGQKITNNYLGQIQNLLRIPDSQKQRVYHIDKGMIYLQNAIRESSDSDFYSDALEEFKKAESIEKKDFFSLYYIGIIYLSAKHYDPANAEHYFRNSARYYLAEALYSGANVTNDLLPADKGFFIEAAEAYLHAAEACYYQKKFSESVELTIEAWKNYPPLTKAGFMQSKYLAANNQDKEAAKILEGVIRTDPPFYMEVLIDKDLNPKPEINYLIRNLAQEAADKAKYLIDECKLQIIPSSNARKYLNEIEILIHENVYLSNIKAIGLFESVGDWKFCDPFENSLQTPYIKEIIDTLSAIANVEYYDVNGNFFAMDADFINNRHIGFINRQTQWIFPAYTSAKVNPNWNSQINAKTCSSCNVIEFINLEKRFNDSLPSVVEDLRILFDKLTIANLEYQEIIENDRKAADLGNLIESFERGIWGGLGGACVGAAVGFCVAVILEVGSCVSHGGEQGMNHPGKSAFILATVLGLVIGYILVFNEKRSKKN